MRRITSKYAGHCNLCGRRFPAGVEIRWSKEAGAYHLNCAPSGDPAADREYAQGIADAQQYIDNKRMFGEQLAEQWEIERELREGWDY